MMMIEMTSSPLALPHPFGDEITTTDAEKGAVGFGGDRFGQITLSRPRRTIQ